MKIAIVGNSAAAISAIETFRKYDKKSEITVISCEKHPPYSRVLLPYFILGIINHNELFYRSPHFYNQRDVRVYLGRSVTNIDVSQKQLYLDTGKKIPFDKLLISSGSQPVRPPIPGVDDEEIEHLWTIEDAVRIKQHFRERKHLLILGGGNISLMLAWVAIQSGMKVTIAELMSQVMPQTLDRKAAELLEVEIKKTGTQVLTGTAIKKIEKDPKGKYLVYPSNQRSFHADMIIVATGVRPSVRFVDADRINIDLGILVNDKMQTSIPDIFAAGDVAQGPTASGQPHKIHALWTTAVEHGAIAGANMAGKDVHYQGSVGSSVSEFFQVTVATIGELQESSHVFTKAYFDSKKKFYVKLFLHRDVPVGGIMLGSAEDVSSLGILKSYILKKQAMPNLDTLSSRPIRPLRHFASPTSYHYFKEYYQ